MTIDEMAARAAAGAGEETGSVSEARIDEIRCEYETEALGIGVASPRLSWTIGTEDAGFEFDRYEIELARDDGSHESAIVESRDQVLVPWPFAPLRSRERVSVNVRVGRGDGWTAPSRTLVIEAGLLEPADWSADLVSPASLGDLDDGAPIVFRDVEVDERPVRARLYVTALGLYEFSINGQRVGEDILTPGWTAYQHRLRYQTYDVTELVTTGAVALRAVLGNGWYRGQLVWPGNRSSYGDRLALLAQLELTFADGTTTTIGTDADWHACRSGILRDDLYDGQSTDRRIRDDAACRRSEPVEVLPPYGGALVARTGPPVRITQTLPATRILTAPSGALIADFGQNLVGWVRLRVRNASPGERVTIRHAEVLEHGELGTRPLRSAKATNEYLLAGDAEETLQPTFTFSGFRYAEISGVPDLRAEDVDALVIGSDLERTGWFVSSDPDLNRLHENVVWSMRGNFLDLPTDCPQRDERLGWTGDIQVFAPTAAFLLDVSGFLAGWLRDLAAEQKPDGGVPYVIPDVLREPDPGAAGWSDAATLVPDALYRAYGDRALLSDQYSSMRAWVEKATRLAGDDHLWNTGFQFGDWLDPTAPPEDAGAAQADKYVVASAYYVRSLRAVRDAAGVLGIPDDAERYDALERLAVAAFNREYVSADGRIRSDCQTVYALALCWQLLDSERKRAGAADRLAELVVEADHRVSTGFVGTPLILDALTIAGRTDLAYAMLLQRECPSWLYAVAMGATTIWERWDSMLPDGAINPGSMTSFNHYAYGAVADWMHRALGGLSPAEPGYRRVTVRPMLSSAGVPVASAQVGHRSPYGDIECDWQIDGDVLRLAVTLPYGVTADVWLPGEVAPRIVGIGTHRFTTALAPTRGSRQSPISGDPRSRGRNGRTS
ncbi:glycoside hydrolase family 78 protein [Pseudolysinimonas kribbensis]